MLRDLGVLRFFGFVFRDLGFRVLGLRVQGASFVGIRSSVRLDFGRRGHWGLCHGIRPSTAREAHRVPTLCHP